MISIRSASAVPWAHVTRVLGAPGDSRTCWCQYFKVVGAEWKTADVASLTSALRQQARRGDPTPGLLAYVDDEPAGWVAVEPRVNYPRLFRNRLVTEGMARPWNEASVWSISCFVVRRAYRSQGVASELVTAAVEHARAAGATVLEAYPVETDDTHLSPASLYHGTVSMFRGAGFSETAVASPKRRVMTLVVREPA